MSEAIRYIEGGGSYAAAVVAIGGLALPLLILLRVWATPRDRREAAVRLGACVLGVLTPLVVGFVGYVQESKIAIHPSIYAADYSDPEPVVEHVMAELSHLLPIALASAALPLMALAVQLILMHRSEERRRE